METLSDEVLCNIASFTCAFELSQVSRTFHTLVHTNKTPVVNRYDDTNFYDIDDDVAYTDIQIEYRVGKKLFADEFARDY